MFPEERRKGVYDVSQIPSTITAHAPGYIDRENEIIVGLQTDAPLKRAIMPNGGFRLIANALKTYGYESGSASRRDVHQVPQDAQRRGVRRLHGRHPALPQLAHPHGPAGRLRPRDGSSATIAAWRCMGSTGSSSASSRRKARSMPHMSTDDVIRDREELAEQIRALKELQADGARATDSTSRALRAARGKPFSGSTSGTWPA